jgi:hypothetical protein
MLANIFIIKKIFAINSLFAIGDRIFGIGVVRCDRL